MIERVDAIANVEAGGATAGGCSCVAIAEAVVYLPLITRVLELAIRPFAGFSVQLSGARAPSWVSILRSHTTEPAATAVGFVMLRAKSSGVV